MVVVLGLDQLHQRENWRHGKLVDASRLNLPGGTAMSAIPMGHPIGDVITHLRRHRADAIG